jgi:hypothetical protein
VKNRRRPWQLTKKDFSSPAARGQKEVKIRARTVIKVATLKRGLNSQPQQDMPRSETSGEGVELFEMEL